MNMRPTNQITVDLNHITHNVSLIRQHLKKSTKLAPCIKANAYGHGLVPVGKHLESIGADWLSVATLEESLQLRQAGITIPIQILSHTYEEDVTLLHRSRLIPFIFDYQMAQRFSTACTENNIQLDVVIKVDTGMSRQGILYTHAFDQIKQIKKLPNLNIISVATHFATADEEDRRYFDNQISRFKQLQRDLKLADIIVPIYQAANSAATLISAESHFDLVRPGISIYGYYPSKYVKEKFETNNKMLQIALQLQTYLSQTKQLPANTSIGYGSTYKTNNPMTIAIVPIGYSHGIDRSLSNTGFVTYGDNAIPIIGRVCMNHMMIDISSVKPVPPIGSNVTVLGTPSLNADHHALWANTINYEIISRLPLDMPRKYV